jgi:UDPglucose 6-dehydrogenase
VSTHLLTSVKSSNDAHRKWAERRLDQLLDGVSGHTVAVWGLAYKPGTDTLRRSSAVELCQSLTAQGARVRAHDPALASLPPDLARTIVLSDSPLSAVDGASALVVATAWPEYAKVAAADVVPRMARRLVLDANRFTRDTLGACADIAYVSVGRARTST